MRLGAGQAGLFDWTLRGEASGEEGAALGEEKRQRRARGGKKKGHNQRQHEGREAESRR